MFVRHTPEQSDLWWGRLSDGASGPLLESADANETWPYWSPAAGLLLYESRPREGTGAEHLWLFDPRTGRTEPFLPGRDLRQHWAAWSPDGARAAYAFSRRRGRNLVSGVAVVEIATRERRVVGPAAERSFYFRPEFAPDGRRLVAEYGGPSSEWHEVWVLEPGVAPRRLVGGVPRSVSKARFSRDGQWVILTSRHRREGPGNLLLLRADGSETRNLASREDADDHSAWFSPTRDEIAFISDRDGSEDLFLADLSGASLRNLTRTPERDEMAPRWSPDGERIALTTRPRGAASGWGAPEDYRVLAVDRRGRVLFAAPGTMADWMSPPP